MQYPIPKLYLHARLDLKSRQTIKEVVDGQQRTHALSLFFNGKQRLTKNIDTPELRGLNYKQLSEGWQERFLTYSLPIDQFSGAPDIEIREAFRRMNANNVPLNDEEQRNAKFQGPFKWYLVGLGDKYASIMYNIKVFSRRDLIRMADLKTFSEITQTIDAGFHTIKGKQIDDLYKKYNTGFGKEVEIDDIISKAMSKFLELTALHVDQFLKPHIFQSIMLALIYEKEDPRLGAVSDTECSAIVGTALAALPSVDMLADSLREPELFPR